jgi:CHAT domain-containing protein
MWWCPTGHFAHLPIHAAGADGEWCSDFVVSSYTPTLGALIEVRAAYTPMKKREVKALVAAVPRSRMEQWADLLSTEEEISTVKATLPEGTLLSLPSPSSFTNIDKSGILAETLLQKLPDATILHLACHGYQDPEYALRSGFVMDDEMLTIERLLPIPLPRAFMAFLSACETAKGDKVCNERCVSQSIG